MESRVELYDFTDIRAARYNTVYHPAHLRRGPSAKVVLLSVDVFSSDHVPGRLRWQAAPVETRVKSAVERGGPRTQKSLFLGTRRSALSRSRVSLDLSPVHGHNQHRNAGIARRAATFPAGTTRWGNVPGCCWQVECSTSPQCTHELLVRRDAPGGGGGQRQGADDGGGGDCERVGKGMQKEEGTGPCDSDPPCDFKYVHRLHASAVPQDVSFGFLTSRESLKLFESDAAHV